MFTKDGLRHLLDIELSREKLKLTSFKLEGAVKGLLRPVLLRAIACLPMNARKHLVVWLDGQLWVPWKGWVCRMMLHDLRVNDPKTFHNFFWNHHLYEYSRQYTSTVVFDKENIEPSRREFLHDLNLASKILDIPDSDICSVVEIGCSLGHLLRFIETGYFSNARTIVGIDIDDKAIQIGSRFLKATDSNIRLIHGDMEKLDDLLGRDSFDLSIAAGVLSYIDEKDATRLVANMIRRTKKLVALAGLAEVEIDNRELLESKVTPNRYHQWVHNFDAMVEKAGGVIVHRRWEGAKLFGGQTVYFVFAKPSP